MSLPAARAPASLLVPYAAPYMLYLAVGLVADRHVHAEWVYGARVILAGSALWLFRGSYLPLSGPRAVGPSVALGALAGLGGAALWVALRAPFPPVDPAPWTNAQWASRALGAVLLPPFMEELLFRGWALRVGVLFSRARAAGSGSALADALERSELGAVAPGEWTALAVAASTAFFALGHNPEEWLAACAYGVLMCGLWIVRGDLVSCISAHAVTNAALAVLARATGAWGSW